jgi:anti-sigma B factor antagonist
MNIQLETVGRTTLVIPQGRLDFGAAPDFERRLQAVLAAAAGTTPSAVIVDCGALEYVSSAGLRVFLIALRTAQRAGISFGLCALTPAVREVFDLSGFSRIIAVYTDRPSALAQASHGQT